MDGIPDRGRTPPRNGDTDASDDKSRSRSRSNGWGIQQKSTDSPPRKGAASPPRKGRTDLHTEDLHRSKERRTESDRRSSEPSVVTSKPSEEGDAVGQNAAQGVTSTRPERKGEHRPAAFFSITHMFGPIIENPITLTDIEIDKFPPFWQVIGATVSSEECNMIDSRRCFISLEKKECSQPPREGGFQGLSRNSKLPLCELLTTMCCSLRRGTSG